LFKSDVERHAGSERVYLNMDLVTVVRANYERRSCASDVAALSSVEVLLVAPGGLSFGRGHQLLPASTRFGIAAELRKTGF
jgi:hypothetical protein